MFAALRTRNYRLWASGQIVSLVGTWMQRVAQDWLVLTLSGGNGFAVGIVMALQFGPTLLLSVWGGVLADRYDKRKLLMITQAFAAVCGLVLGVLDVGNIVELWHVYVIAFVLGCSSAIDAPVRQSFTIEMVGKETLSNAIALNSMTFNSARIIGPAVSGVLITLIGTGWVFLINAVSFAGVFGALLAMRAKDLYRVEPAPRAKGQVRAGFAYVWGRPDLRVLLATVFMVSTFGLNFPLSLAVLARNSFGSGADAYGLLSTTLAVGTLAGATLAARRTSSPRLRLFIGAVIAFGAFELLVGLMPNYVLVAILLVPTGALTLTFTTSAMNILQMSVPSDMRGRVMGIYMLCFLGGTPLGSPVLGWLADVLDPRAPLVFGGIVSLATGVVAGVYLMRRGKLRVTLVRGTDRLRLPVMEVRRSRVCDASEQAVEVGTARSEEPRRSQIQP
ncbi:MFS transporter [Rhodococcoides kyotonense]|uniref:Predicted arabinose efflux permease, MFS family n=1 Tax=Rhodococcoides kyotonense TaxID=398843 RepID=A0A239EA50_9NOCA|nr:MFS transporter [Rhodococcus kyotonensis]SNS41506.1 Predicted arabinose efflux permease, MFS family [Rhodococcus kyotonensis]